MDAEELYGYEPQDRTNTVYTVRVTEGDGFRDVRFNGRAEAKRFKAMAEEDGTYWGWQEGYE